DVIRAAERYPDRLIPLAFIQLGQDKPNVVAEVHGQGFKGLKFIDPLVPYDDVAALPFYEKAEELSMPILFHCGVLAWLPGQNTSSDYMRPLRLDGIARRFPGLRMQIAHLGVPEYEIAATMARMLPNVFVDMTGNPEGGWYTSKTSEFIRSLFYWPDWHRKVIFGTDVRSDLMREAVQHHQRLLSSFNMTDPMEEAVYRDNCRRFLGEISVRGSTK
ncbi:unnamed protein product, partial [marine sediment metagenome]